MTNSNIKLPCELDVMAIPPLATLTILDVALSMATAVVHCEHINLDELDLYCADGETPPTSMVLARDIVTQSKVLRKTIAKYVRVMTCHQDLQSVANPPF